MKHSVNLINLMTQIETVNKWAKLSAFTSHAKSS